MPGLFIRLYDSSPWAYQAKFTNGAISPALPVSFFQHFRPPQALGKSWFTVTSRAQPQREKEKEEEEKLASNQGRFRSRLCSQCRVFERGEGVGGMFQNTFIALQRVGQTLLPYQPTPWPPSHAQEGQGMSGVCCRVFCLLVLR